MTATLIVAAIMVIGVIISFFRLFSAVKRVDISTNIAKSVSELQVVGYDYIFHPGAEEQAQWEVKISVLSGLLDNSRFSSPLERDLLREIRWHFEKTRVNFLRLQKELDQDASARQDSLSQERQKQQIAQLLQGTQIMAARAHQLETRIISQLTLEQRLAGISLAFGLFVIMLVAILAFYGTTEDMYESLRHLKKGTEIIGEGDLTHRIEHISPDEIGEVSIAFNKMAERLNRTSAQKDVLESEIQRREQTQRELETSNETMNAILAASPVSILLVEKRAIVWVNEAFTQMFHFDNSGQYCGKPLSILFNDREGFSRTENTLMEKAVEHLPQEVETTLKRTDGLAFPGVVRISSHDTMNPFYKAVVTITDESWRVQAQTEQVQRDRLQGALEMAGSVCHELNQPLQYLLGTSELHLMKLEQGDEDFIVFEKIKRMAERMAEITQKLMGLTKYETVQYGKGFNIFDIHKQLSENTEEMDNGDGSE
jgi:signal transduction histidine kinase